jgi:heptosyltransferase I
MAAILFVKTSSLGDVIHHMPAVSDARRHRPQAQIAWVVEELFAPLAALHPAVDTVIPVATRRWRRAFFDPSTWSQIRHFAHSVRACTYDQVIDAQGLLRSALITRLATGVRHGYDRESVRESVASLAYDVKHRVAWQQHAIARNRTLTGLALGYEPEGAIDYGLDRRVLAGPAPERTAVLLHATARPEKEWPVERWIALGHSLNARGYEVILPWGNAAERARSAQIAAALDRARVPDLRPLDDVARLIARATLAVGVDTGLVHLAAALGVPLAAIFVGTPPSLYGPMGRGPIAIVGDDGHTPSVEEVEAAIGQVGG